MHVLRVERLIGQLNWSISENPKNILGYQASSSYNLEEFPAVITKVASLPGRGDWSLASLGDDIDLGFDDRQGLDIIMVVIFYLVNALI